MEKTKKIVTDIFQLINDAQSIEDIKSIHKIYQKVEGVNLEKYFPNDNYPRVYFSLNTNEINIMKDSGLLNKDGSIDLSVASKNDLTPLEKLLYAVLWKNGDLKKEKHIVNGILASTEDNHETPSGGLVFYYFGKHLQDKTQPIIDQHVLRAYLLQKSIGNDQIEFVRRKKTLSPADKEECESYLTWHDKQKSKFDDFQHKVELTYHLDRLLFGLGKSIKLN